MPSEIYSPNVEEFSEQEILISQETEHIKRINEGIEKDLLKKMKEKPTEAIIPNGLNENFLKVLHNQYSKSLKFIHGDEDELQGYMKIRVLNYEHYLKELLYVQFESLSDLPSDQSDYASFMYLPLEFEKNLNDHKTYDVKFWPNVIVINKCYIRNLMSIRASSSVLSNVQ